MRLKSYFFTTKQLKAERVINKINLCVVDDYLFERLCLQLIIEAKK